MSAATTATYLAIAATTVSAYSSMQAADAAERQGQAQKQQADYNAEVARLQGIDAVNRGNVAAEQQRKKVAMIQGAQRAAMGGSGGNVETGTFADIQLDTATLGETDAQNIRTNSLREAWGYKNQATNYAMAGEEALRSGAEKANYYRGQAAGTVLTGASTVGKSMGWFDAKPSPNAGSGTGLKWK